MNAIKIQEAMCTPVPALALRPKVLPCNPFETELRKNVADPLWLVRECANAFFVDAPLLREHDRHKSVAAARHVFWWLARGAWGTSFPELGRMLRSEPPFDHSTVMSAVARIEKLVEKERRFVVGLEPEGSDVGRTALALKKRMEEATGG